MLPALALLIVPAAAGGVSPFETFKTGKLQCMAPDRGGKTCSSISRYAPSDDGTVLSEDKLMLSSNPDIVVTIHAPSTVNGNRICQKPDAAQLRSALVSRDGTELAESEAAPYRENLVIAFTPLFDRVICMELSGDDPLYIAEFEFDGAPEPSNTSRVRLIAPDEGYRLRPLN